MRTIRIFRKGGLTFLQVGQFSLSWCITRRREPFWTWERDHALNTAAATVNGAFVITLIRFLV